MKPKLAQRMQRLQASPIREILAIANQADVISFAGGLPASETLPTIESVRIDQASLQYGASEGDQALRESVALDLQKRGFETQSNRVLILSGSQQGIDLVAKLVIERDTKVAVESPTYLAALQVFTMFGASYVPFCIDSIPNSSPSSLSKMRSDTSVDAVAESDMLYLNPTFQNPSSRVYTGDQRLRLAEYCDSRQLLLFEDDPYTELYYEPCDRQAVCSLLGRTSWVYQSSFSKTIAPGMRLGYLTCSEDLYPHLLKLKQAADLHSNRISQSLVLSHLNDANANKRLHALRAIYKDKRDKFDDILQQHFAHLATWQLPMGGLFFWLRLKTPRPIDTRKLLQDAIDAGVTFMPGEPFFIHSTGAASHIRLNFSHAPIEHYELGLSRLSAIVNAAIVKATA